MTTSYYNCKDYKAPKGPNDLAIVIGGGHCRAAVGRFIVASCCKKRKVVRALRALIIFSLIVGATIRRTYIARYAGLYVLLIVEEGLLGLRSSPYNAATAIRRTY